MRARRCSPAKSDTGPAGISGYSGLAQREGFRTPEALVQFTTGSTAREATTLVQVGTMVHDSMIDPTTDTAAPDAHGIQYSRARTVAEGGRYGSDERRVIRRSGTSHPERAGRTERSTTTVSVSRRISSPTRRGSLLEVAVTLNADQLYKRARALRDDLDEAGIADREKAIYQERSFRRVKRPNGLSRFILDPDLETSAYLDDVYDKLTSPRRGGPRFIDEADKAWAEGIANDERTTDQYLHDAVTALLRLGVAADQV